MSTDTPSWQSLEPELLRRADQELKIRGELVQNGTINDEYHPHREALHIANAAWLDERIAEMGLPTNASLTNEGMQAAFSIIRDAISLPQFQRRVLPLLQAAAETGRCPRVMPAILEDCIRMHEGRALKFGLYFDWENPLPIEDLEHLDERRTALGLSPMVEAIATHGRLADNFPSSTDPEGKRIAYQLWRKRVGWA